MTRNEILELINTRLEELDNSRKDYWCFPPGFIPPYQTAIKELTDLRNKIIGLDHLGTNNYPYTYS